MNQVLVGFTRRAIPCITFTLMALAYWPIDSGDASSLSGLHAVRVTDIGPPNIHATQVSVLRDKAYFRSQGLNPATGTLAGLELWSFDGKRVELAADINPGFSSSSPRYFIEYQSAIYFQANDGNAGYELWSYDGQQASLVRSFANSSTSGDPSEFVVWNDQLFFTASATGGGGAPRALWRYDGSSFFLMTGAVSSFSHLGQYVAGSDGFYFVTGQGLNRFDGLSTSLVSNLSGTRLAALDDEILFVRSDSNSDALWRYSEGSVELVETGFLRTRLLPLSEFQGDFYYLASRENDPTDLWKYDGQNFVPVASFKQNGLYNSYSGHIVTDELLFLGIDDDTHGSELWVFDGKEIRMLPEINPGTESSFPTGFFELGKSVYFFAEDRFHGSQLWVIVPEPSSVVLCLLAVSITGVGARLMGKRGRLRKGPCERWFE